MSDSVNRELVLGYIDYVRVIGVGKKKALEYLRKYVEHLPSDRPNGKWLKDDEGTFICSACGSGYKDQPTLMGKPLFEWCPLCGARMKGADDENCTNHCEIDGHEIGYVDCFVGWCKHWAKSDKSQEEGVSDE